MLSNVTGGKRCTGPVPESSQPRSHFELDILEICGTVVPYSFLVRINQVVAGSRNFGRLGSNPLPEKDSRRPRVREPVKFGPLAQRTGHLATNQEMSVRFTQGPPYLRSVRSMDRTGASEAPNHGSTP